MDESLRKAIEADILTEDQIDEALPHLTELHGARLIARFFIGSLKGLESLSVLRKPETIQVLYNRFEKHLARLLRVVNGRIGHQLSDVHPATVSIAGEYQGSYTAVALMLGAKASLQVRLLVTVSADYITRIADPPFELSESDAVTHAEHIAALAAKWQFDSNRLEAEIEKEFRQLERQQPTQSTEKDRDGTAQQSMEHKVQTAFGYLGLSFHEHDRTVWKDGVKVVDFGNEEKPFLFALALWKSRGVTIARAGVAEQCVV